MLSSRLRRRSAAPLDPTNAIAPNTPNTRRIANTPPAPMSLLRGFLLHGRADAGRGPQLDGELVGGPGRRAVRDDERGAPALDPRHGAVEREPARSRDRVIDHRTGNRRI